MKTLKEFSGQYLVTNNGQRLVILTRVGAQNPGHCYYMENDFSKVNKHKKLEFECLDPKVEWNWALSNWGKKPVIMSGEEVNCALNAIRNLPNVITNEQFTVIPSVKPATQSLGNDEGLLALRQKLLAG